MITVCDLRIDRGARRLTMAGESVDLTPREFDLLVALATSAGDVVSQSELIETVWDAHWAKSTHTLAVHVSSLRSKLHEVGGPTISTIAGRGYRLDGVPSNR